MLEPVPNVGKTLMFHALTSVVTQ